MIIHLALGFAAHCQVSPPIGCPNAQVIDPTQYDRGSYEPPAIGVALSGGGMRSFSCACGQIRALQKIGLWSKVKVLSASSGGGWFALAHQHSDDSDDEKLLGPVTTPGEFSQNDRLGDWARKKFCLRYAATLSLAREASYLYFMRGYFFNDRGYFKSFSKAMDKAFLKPYSTSETIARTSPEYIVGIALLGPSKLSPFDEEKRQYSLLEASTRWVGSPGLNEIEFTRNDGKSIDEYVGGWIPSQYFGATWIHKTHQGKRVDTLEFKTPSTSLEAPQLAAIVGSSLVDAVNSHEGGIGKLIGSPWAGLISVNSPYLSPASLHVSQKKQAKPFLMGDGGIIDNLNLIPLVRRPDINKILVLANFQIPLADLDHWNSRNESPTYDPDTSSYHQIDPCLPSYFGINLVPNKDRFGYYLEKNQCFSRDSFPKLIEALQQAQDRGSGIALASVDLETVANQHYGIKAGLKKRLVVLHLSRVQAWEEKLPRKMEKQLRDDSVFPFYVASHPLKDPLTPAAVDALAFQSSWAIITSKDYLYKKLVEEPL